MDTLNIEKEKGKKKHYIITRKIIGLSQMIGHNSKFLAYSRNEARNSLL